MDGLPGLQAEQGLRSAAGTCQYVEHPGRVHESAGSGFGRPKGARRGRATDGAPQRGENSQIRVRSSDLERNAG